jgi:hypothetical protein
MTKKSSLGGLSSFLVVMVSLAGCNDISQKQIVNITGPTPVTGGDGGGGGVTPTPPPTNPPPAGTAPGSFTLHSAVCSPISDREHKASFSWSVSSGAVNYRVERRVWSTGPWTSQGVHSGPTFEQMVDASGDFYYRVISKNEHGETIASPVELFVCGAKPTAGGGDNGGGGTPPPPPPPPPTDPPPPPPPPPTTPKPVVTFTATPSNINVGHASLLNWVVQHATSCERSGGWSGDVGPTGSQSVSPATTTTYILSCTGAGGTTSVSVTVNVTAPPPGVKTITISPVSGSGKKDTTEQVTATCRIDGVITSCSPWWSSSDPSRVSVGSTNGLVKYVWPGSADVCAQWSKTEVTPRACGTRTTTP